MNPKVSVIVPIYNVEKYIEQCIGSLTNQTLKDIEILCIDDCGTDNSMKFLYDYANKHNQIKIIRHEKNMGLGAARNTGLEHAIGEYIGFIDSDDYVLPNFYEELLKTARQYDADIVQSTIRLYHEDSTAFEDYNFNDKIIEFNSNMADIVKMDIYYNAGMCWNKIFRKKIIQNNNLRFPVGLLWEDNPFVIRSAFYANKIIPTSNTNYIYRQRPGSIVKLQNKKIHFDLIKTHEDIINFLNSTQTNESDYLMLFDRFMSRVYYEYLKLNKYDQLRVHRADFKLRWQLLFKMCKYPNEFKLNYKKTYNLIHTNRKRSLLKITERCFAIVTVILIIFLKVICFSPILIYKKLKGNL